MSMEGMPQEMPNEAERIDDVDKARAMAEASDEAHTHSAKTRERINGSIVEGRTKDGIYVPIYTSNDIQSERRDAAFWDSEARRDENIAARKHDAGVTQKDQSWMKWFRN